MAPRITFVDYDPGLQTIPLALDQAFADTGKLGIIECVATGTNTIALTPLAAAFPPEITAYATGLHFGFVTAGASTGSVTVNVSGVGAKNLYRQDGSIQVGSNELVSGGYYAIVYQASLNGGAGGFMLTAGAGGVLNLTGLVITPPANTNDRGFTITQSSPTSGSVAGPIDFNKISVNNQGAVTSSGGDPYATHEARALHIELTEGGPNIGGFQNALRVRLNHTITGPSNIHSTGASDHIALVTIADSNQDATGAGLYSVNALVAARSGASHGHMVGVNAEVGMNAGAAVDYVAGFRSQKYDTAHGAITDAAYTLFKSDAGEGWTTGFLLNEWNSTQSIASTGQIMASANALSIANGFKLDNVTFTSDFILTPHYKFTGSGVVTVNQTVSAVITPPIGTQMHLVSAGTYGLTLDAYAGGEGALHLRRASSVITSPGALAADDLIGAVNFIGHTGVGYTANGKAAIFGHAGENWSGTATGTYIDFYTTPLTSTTRARAVRITPAGGIAIGHTGNTAIGSISGTGSATFNSFLATGGVGVGTGEVRIGGNTSGAVVLTAQAAAGTPTVMFGTSSGTPVVTASSPLTITAATGNLTITTGTLSRVDDTNVTLTLGGTPTNALLNAVSLTLGWTGMLAVARGGSGAGTLTGLLQGNGTSAFTAVTNSTTVGQVLRVTGANTYAFGALDLADSDAVTGILPAANGGTGDAGGAWTTYTPTVTAGSGTWTSGTASGAYKIIGKSVFLKLRYVNTTTGTATGSIIWSLPFTLSENNQVINGVEYQLNGKMMRGIATTTTQIQAKYYDNAFVPTGGERYVLEGVLDLA